MRLLSIPTPAPPEGAPAARPAPGAPVFVGGCDRSGTTLLGAMLGAHPDCTTTPESQFKFDLLASLSRSRTRDGGRGPTLARLAGELESHGRYRLWGLEPGLAIRAAEAVASELRATPDAPADARGVAELIERLVEAYAAKEGRARPHAPCRSRWIDHTPDNLRRAAHLLELYPDARFVHLVRDGRSVAASVLPLDWGPPTIREAATWWVAKTAYGLALEGLLPADRIRRVRYEDLVREPEATLRELSGFLELPWDPAVLAGDGFRAPSYTTAQHRLVGRRPDAGRARSYRERLSAREIEIFEWATHDMLAYLGYEPEFGLRARPPRLREKASFLVTKLHRRWADRRRKRSRLHRALAEAEADGARGAERPPRPPS